MVWKVTLEEYEGDPKETFEESGISDSVTTRTGIQLGRALSWSLENAPIADRERIREICRAIEELEIAGSFSMTSSDKETMKVLEEFLGISKQLYKLL
jgi:hypothetical protein